MKTFLGWAGITAAIGAVYLGATSVVAAPVMGPKQVCVNAPTVVNALDMQASRTGVIDTGNDGNYGVLDVFIKLTDANSSITRFDMTCTGSKDGNTTAYKLQSCTTASGTCTSSDATWQKATPGSANWIWRVDVEGMPDVSCVFAVGTGAGASADLLTVDYRMCTKGS